MPIRMMLNGLPGRMARAVAGLAAHDPRFALVPVGLTGPDIVDRECAGDGYRIELVHRHGVAPPERAAAALDRAAEGGAFIAVDYTHPTAVIANARLYAERGIPFVMGTTGGDRAELLKISAASAAPSVVAPNMAMPVVALQAAFEHLAGSFPGLFAGYSLAIRESHQATKADTSGTARAMVDHFRALGCDFPVDRIEKIRDETSQRAMGIPPADLAGHAYHTYSLRSPDGTVDLTFTHNVRGRAVYATGTLAAVRFLAARLAENAPPRVYSMIDVLRGLTPA